MECILDMLPPPREATFIGFLLGARPVSRWLHSIFTRTQEAPRTERSVHSYSLPPTKYSSFSVLGFARDYDSIPTRNGSTTVRVTDWGGVGWGEVGWGGLGLLLSERGVRSPVAV